jgi:hypothetical protein
VRFALEGDPLLSMACHCKGCQRMTAGAYSLSLGYPRSALTILSGEPVIGGLHGATRHYHCDYCKSWLYTEPDAVPDFVNVRTTMLDNPPSEPPFVETYAAEGLPWARTGAAHRYENLPAMEEWPQLMQQFAGTQGKVQG